jgi:hypothetical protein
MIANNGGTIFSCGGVRDKKFNFFFPLFILVLCAFNSTCKVFFC